MKTLSRLFVYGTLRDPELVEQLTGKRFPTEEAWLLDYERHELPHAYPFVTPAPGKRVRGLIVHDVDSQSLAAFDRYECVGVLYDRVEAQAETAGGRKTVFVYVGRQDQFPSR